MSTKLRRIFAALALSATLAFPAGVFAANPATSNETLTITASYTLTGVPASLSYAAPFSAAAQNIKSTTPDSTISWNSSYGPGTTLSVLASNLTGGSPASIAANQRQLVYNTRTNTNASASGVPTNATTPLVIGDTITSADASFELEAHINAPAGAVGVYTGTLVFTVTQ